MTGASLRPEDVERRHTRMRQKAAFLDDERPAGMYEGFVPDPPVALATMDVFGVCCSRDVFGITADFLGGNGRIKINKYLRGLSFVALFDPHVGPEASPEDFRSIPFEFYTHESAVKNSLSDYNKTGLQELSSSGSEWLMVDGVCVPHGVRRITYFDGSTELISNFIERQVYGVRKVLKNKGVLFEMETMVDVDADLYDERLSRFVEFVLRRYGNKIILNCASYGEGYLDENGEYRLWDTDPRRNMEI